VLVHGKGDVLSALFGHWERSCYIYRTYTCAAVSCVCCMRLGEVYALVPAKAAWLVVELRS